MLGLLRFVGRRVVGYDAHHLLGQRIFAAEYLESVVVGFGHFLAVDAGDQASRLRNERLGDDERLTVKRVELDGDVPGHFKVLFLVLPHRDNVRSEEKDIGGHKNGIAEETVMGGHPPAHLVFVRGRPLKHADAGDIVQHPSQLRHFGNIGLDPEYRLLGIHPEREKICCRFNGIPCKRLPVCL